MVGPAAFWSYSHEDDRHDRGAILDLAQDIGSEFSLLTGKELTLFVDRDEIMWGDEWRRRLDEALRDTTFFIPVITPRYFARMECRKELLHFSGAAQSLGVSELIMPILYVPVQSLEADNPDEAVALIARMQYSNWTDLRLVGRASPEYRTAIHGLATRLAERAEVVVASQMAEEQAEPSAPPDELGLAELSAAIARLLPTIEDVVDDDTVTAAQHDATWMTYRDRLNKLIASGAPASALFATLHRLATHDLPIAEHRLELAREYAASTVELDPLVTTAIRAARAHPGSGALLVELRELVSKIVAKIKLSESEHIGRETATEFSRRFAHASRTMRHCADTYDKGDQLVEEANAIILRWDQELAALSI